jgi:hypothetical protein
MGKDEISVEQILKFMREQIASQAQEIAMLKATIVALSSENDKVE